ncbi:hypothetical protein FRB91_007664 [Serendipita sp. 411]|nr:hypothetical protein FRB91_007664 [Serendipita sp. 411]
MDIVAHAALAGVYKWSQNLIRNLEDECWVGAFRRVINLPLMSEAKGILRNSSKQAVTLFFEYNREHSSTLFPGEASTRLGNNESKQRKVGRDEKNEENENEEMKEDESWDEAKD